MTGSHARVRPLATILAVTRLRPGLAMAAIAACAALVGCGSGGVAATVGDQTISIETLQSQYEAIAAFTPTPVPQDQLLATGVAHLLVAQVADEQGLVLDEADVDAALSQQGLEETGSAGYDAAVRDEMRFRLQVSALSEQGVDVTAAVAELSDEIGVQVNPRYGTWTGLEIEPGTGSISVPATPAASEG
jgi:hypothetical protein